MDTKQIISVCTDGASSYTGHLAGMHQKLIADEQYKENILHIPDVCHRIECLLKSTMPEWLEDLLDETSTIANYFSSKTLLAQKFFHYGNSDGALRFFFRF